MANGVPPYEQPYREPELSAADWAGQPGDFGHDPYQQGHGNDLGFAQAEGGELDPVYGEDEEYEEYDAPRSRRPILVLAALAGAILVGGGMAYAYKKFASSEPQGDPPIIKSEAFPSKTKPADAGGKTFPYSDTKIMGRLGDGTSTAGNSATPNLPPASPENSQSASADPSADNGGPRRVSTLVVGRDGSIQAPSAPDSAPSAGPVSVPGTSVVDLFGQNNGGTHPGRDEPAPQARQSSPAKGDDAPSPDKPTATPVKITKINSSSGSKSPTATGSIDERDDAAAPSPKRHMKRVARAEPATTSDAESTPPPITSSANGSGYVAVLASIPHSSSSRMDALKRYADMQQKYSTALAGKTPDVASANLGAKGNYDRLIVGPPGSRQEANNVCAQLKAEGYTSCWVTTY
jgi:hypothetical protein